MAKKGRDPSTPERDSENESRSCAQEDNLVLPNENDRQVQALGLLEANESQRMASNRVIWPSVAKAAIFREHVRHG